MILRPERGLKDSIKQSNYSEVLIGFRINMMSE
jgi:hypothetical protein